MRLFGIEANGQSRCAGSTIANIVIKLGRAALCRNSFELVAAGDCLVHQGNPAGDHTRRRGDH